MCLGDHNELNHQYFQLRFTGFSEVFNFSPDLVMDFSKAAFSLSTANRQLSIECAMMFGVFPGTIMAIGAIIISILKSKIEKSKIVRVGSFDISQKKVIDV